MKQRPDTTRVVAETVFHATYGMILRGTFVATEHPLTEILALEPWSPPDVLAGHDKGRGDVVVAIETFVADDVPVRRGEAYAAKSPMVEARPDLFTRWTPPPIDTMEVRGQPHNDEVLAPDGCKSERMAVTSTGSLYGQVRSG